MSATTVIPKNRTVHIETVMHIIECAGCSIDFGIGDDFMARRRKDHATFYCPNGHTNYYSGDNAEEKIRKELEAARSLAQREARRRSCAEARERTAEYRRRAAKGQLTKIRNRIAKGDCPECHRHFSDVLAHMATKHPDFALPEGDES